MVGRISTGVLLALTIAVAGLLSSSIPAYAFDQQSNAGTSTCSAGVGTQVLSLTNVGSMNDLLDVSISWKVGANCGNTGPTTPPSQVSIKL